MYLKTFYKMNMMNKHTEEPSESRNVKMHWVKMRANQKLPEVDKNSDKQSSPHTSMTSKFNLKFLAQSFLELAISSLHSLV